MKILLIGEYSRFHNSLKEGLQSLGHTVTIIGSGDGFKKYPVDIDISPKTSNANWFIIKIRHALFKFLTVDIAKIETGYRFWKHRHLLKEYDVVQFINSWSIRTTIAKEKKCIRFIEKHNKQLFLSACGTDTPWVESLLNDTELPYNLLTPYRTDPNLKKAYLPTLRYIREDHKNLYSFLYDKVKAVIPTDMDYYIGLQHINKTTLLIPTPINFKKLEFSQSTIGDTIVIFHGINKTNYLKKGNDIFEKALEIIENKYASRIEIITAISLPYTEYMEAYDKAHILLDQVYSHDQGYNALEAMAKGKVVFTGAGDHFKKHYNLDKIVAIDATPDPQQIAKALEELILHPKQIITIGKNARNFVEEYHSHTIVAKQYLNIWKA